jgi:hypothetical protein
MPDICPKVRQVRARWVKESNSLLPIRWKNTGWRESERGSNPVFNLYGYVGTVDIIPAANKEIKERSGTR